MPNVIISCPKCKIENPIDLFKADEGSRILCRGCNEFITLTFKGKTPKQLIEEVVNEIQKSLPKTIKIRLE